jgi:hypothetical protein
MGQTIQTDYHSPVGIPIILAANFGELRTNHFHTGIDIKTNGREGYNLYAIEDGYVSRINISPTGYGKALYLNHPNGITSVYAHCSGFSTKIDSLIKHIQSQEQNFEIDINLTKEQLPVVRGEIIGLSGNSGSSTAPHLHFELRETSSEHALNPLVYGFKVADHKSPEIRGLKVYSVTKDGYRIPGKSNTIPVSKGKYGYYIGGDEVLLSSDFCPENGGIGLGLDIIDRLDDAPNVCGLYGSYMLVSEDTTFAQRIDKISFETSRYIKSHTDSEEFSYKRRNYHKSFKTKDNPLFIYPRKGLGILKLVPGEEKNIHFITYDTKENTSELKFKLKIETGPFYSRNDYFQPASDYIYPDKSYVFKDSTTVIDIPIGCVYEPVLLRYKSGEVVCIGESNEPIQKPFTVRMKPSQHLLKNEYAYLEVKLANGRTCELETTNENGWLKASSKYFGTISIQTDLNSPSISPLNFSNSDLEMRKSLMTWRITDAETGLIDYDIFIDGEWALLEYESKGSYGVFHVPAELKGKHEVKLIAKDQVGNIQEWKKDLIFY